MKAYHEADCTDREDSDVGGHLGPAETREALTVGVSIQWRMARTHWEEERKLDRQHLFELRVE